MNQPTHKTYIPSADEVEAEIAWALSHIGKSVIEPMRARQLAVAKTKPEAADAMAEVHMAALVGFTRHFKSRASHNPAFVEKLASDAVISLIRRDVAVNEELMRRMTAGKIS